MKKKNKSRTNCPYCTLPYVESVPGIERPGYECGTYILGKSDCVSDRCRDRYECIRIGRAQVEDRIQKVRETYKEALTESESRVLAGQDELGLALAKLEDEKRLKEKLQTSWFLLNVELDSLKKRFNRLAVALNILEFRFKIGPKFGIIDAAREMLEFVGQVQRCLHAWRRDLLKMEEGPVPRSMLAREMDTLQTHSRLLMDILAQAQSSIPLAEEEEALMA